MRSRATSSTLVGGVPNRTLAPTVSWPVDGSIASDHDVPGSQGPSIGRVGSSTTGAGGSLPGGIAPGNTPSASAPSRTPIQPLVPWTSKLAFELSCNVQARCSHDLPSSVDQESCVVP